MILDVYGNGDVAVSCVSVYSLLRDVRTLELCEEIDEAVLAGGM